MPRQLPAAIVLLTDGSAGGQGPTFEVASIKRNNSGSEAASVRGQAGRGTIGNNIISSAWGLQGFQNIGGPDGINLERRQVSGVCF